MSANQDGTRAVMRLELNLTSPALAHRLRELADDHVFYRTMQWYTLSPFHCRVTVEYVGTIGDFQKILARIREMETQGWAESPVDVTPRLRRLPPGQRKLKGGTK